MGGISARKLWIRTTWQRSPLTRIRRLIYAGFSLITRTLRELPHSKVDSVHLKIVEKSVTVHAALGGAYASRGISFRETGLAHSSRSRDWCKWTQTLPGDAEYSAETSYLKSTRNFYSKTVQGRSTFSHAALYRTLCFPAVISEPLWLASFSAYGYNYGMPG